MTPLTCPLGDLCPSLYTVKGQSYKQSIIFGTISCCLAVHADQRRAPYVFILWTKPPLMVWPMSTHEGIGVHTPTTVQDYVECFNAVLCHSRNLSAAQKAELFVGGLPEHIKVDVKLRDL